LPALEIPCTTLLLRHSARSPRSPSKHQPPPPTITTKYQICQSDTFAICCGIHWRFGGPQWCSHKC